MPGASVGHAQRLTITQMAEGWNHLEASLLTHPVPELGCLYGSLYFFAVSGFHHMVAALQLRLVRLLINSG